MANNIGNIYGYGGNTIGGYYLNQGNKGVNNNPEPEVTGEEQTPERVDVDPNEVLNFLAASSIKINTAPAVTPANDAATAERIDGYIQSFEMIYNVISQEFGEKVANQLMDDDAFIDALMSLS